MYRLQQRLLKAKIWTTNKQMKHTSHKLITLKVVIARSYFFFYPTDQNNKLLPQHPYLMIMFAWFVRWKWSEQCFNKNTIWTKSTLCLPFFFLKVPHTHLTWVRQDKRTLSWALLRSSAGSLCSYSAACSLCLPSRLICRLVPWGLC